MYSKMEVHEELNDTDRVCFKATDMGTKQVLDLDYNKGWILHPLGLS